MTTVNSYAHWQPDSIQRLKDLKTKCQRVIDSIDSCSDDLLDNLITLEFSSANMATEVDYYNKVNGHE